MRFGRQAGCEDLEKSVCLEGERGRRSEYASFFVVSALVELGCLTDNRSHRKSNMKRGGLQGSGRSASYHSVQLPK